MTSKTAGSNKSTEILLGLRDGITMIKRNDMCDYYYL